MGEVTKVGIFVVTVLGGLFFGFLWVFFFFLPRKPHFEVDWEGLGGRLPWGQKERGRERWTDRRRLRYLANLCCPKAEGTGLLPVELAAGGSLSRILTTARRGGP